MARLSASILEELWFGEDDPASTAENAAESFAAKFAEVEGLRPFSVVVQKVIAYVGSPDFRVERVGALVEEDPALASRILRVANSVAFQTRVPCHSIHDAIVRLGARTVSDLACGIATMTAFQDLRGDSQLVRDHCVGTAAVARHLAYRARGVEAPERAFLVGLLHDIGRLLLLQTRDRSYAELPGVTAAGSDELHLAERSALGYDHAVLGGHVLSRWGLPEPLPKIVAWHHQPTRAQHEGGAVAVMVAVLRIADFVDGATARRQVLDAQAVQRLAASADAAYIGVKQSDLASLCAEAAALRRDAVALFH